MEVTMDLDAKTLNEKGNEYLTQGYASLEAGGKSAAEKEKGLACFKQAEGFLRKACDLDPANGKYILDLADSLFAQSRPDEANVYFKDAIKNAEPGSGRLAEIRDRWGKSVYSPNGAEVLETLGMKNCRDAEQLNKEGRGYMKQGYAHADGKTMEYFEKAEACYRGALGLNPANWHYQLNVADSLFAQGRKAEANQQFDAAIGKTGAQALGVLQSDHVMGVIERWGNLIDSVHVKKARK
jgi:tetratricopeptide (TPR) repeat protein